MRTCRRTEVVAICMLSTHYVCYSTQILHGGFLQFVFIAAALASFPLFQGTWSRHIAWRKHKLHWLEPIWGEAASGVPLQTQCLLAELQQSGLYVVLLPLICNGFRASLSPAARYVMTFHCLASSLLWGTRRRTTNLTAGSTLSL